MTSPFSEELISAYLDGELTAQEQAHVEKHLREDAGLRRMCDELRVLRTTLQSMPTEDLSQDLAERVLRQAERRMLLGDEEVAQEDSAAPQAIPSPAGPPVTAAIPMRRNWRFIAGCVASAAAMFLAAILLFGPSQFASKPDTVAQGPSTESSSSTAGGLEESLDKRPLALDGESATNAPNASLRDLAEGSQSAPDDAVPQRGSVELGMARDAPRDAFSDGVLLRKDEHVARSGGSGSGGSGSGGSGSDEAGTGFGATALEAAPSPAGMPNNVASDADPSMRPRLKSRAFGSGVADSGVADSGGSENSSRPKETAGSSLAGSGSPPPGDVSSADSGYPSAGMGGMPGSSGAALGKQPSDTTSGEPTNLNAYEYGATPGLRNSLPFSASGTLGPAVLDDASRKKVAQQLVQRLDAEQTLLVQVTLPRELEIRFREAATTSDENRQRLSAAAWELLDAKILPAVELKAPSSRGAQQLRQEVNPGIENVILVNGAPADVRKLVERLANRADILVQTSTTVSGQALAEANVVDALAADSQSQPAPPQLSRALMTQESPAPSGDDPATIADMTKGKTANSDKQEAAGVARSVKSSYGLDSAQPSAGNSSDSPNSENEGYAKKSLDSGSLGSRGPASGQSGAAGQPAAGPPATSGRRSTMEDRGNAEGAAPAEPAAGEKQASEDIATQPQAMPNSSEPAAVPAAEMEVTPPQPQAVVYFLFRFRPEPATVAPPKPADAAQSPSEDK